MVGGAAKVDPLSTGAAAPFLRKKLQLGLEKPSCGVKYKYANPYIITQELYFK